MTEDIIPLSQISSFVDIHAMALSGRILHIELLNALNAARDYAIPRHREASTWLLILNFLERSTGCFFFMKCCNVVFFPVLSVNDDDTTTADCLDLFAMETVSRIFVINERTR